MVQLVMTYVVEFHTDSTRSIQTGEMSILRSKWGELKLIEYWTRKCKHKVTLETLCLQRNKEKNINKEYNDWESKLEKKDLFKHADAISQQPNVLTNCQMLDWQSGGIITRALT